MHGIVLSFYFYWLHIICYKFWFCNDESPLCLLQSPFPMLQNRFNFSQCLLTSSQFAFLFWDATHKGTTLGLQIECADRGLYVYRKVTAQSFCWAEGSCREPHSWPQPQTLFPSSLSHVQAEMVARWSQTSRPTLANISFACRDLPSHANTLIWENIPSLLSVRPCGERGEFSAWKLLNQLQKIQYNPFRG